MVMQSIVFVRLIYRLLQSPSSSDGDRSNDHL